MKLTLAALLALAFAASATPASACFLLGCIDQALADDSYPPGDPPLPPTLQMLIRARDGRGLSLEGFYNDPALALALRERPVVRARY
jgi:hypothetical protein